MKDQAKKKPHYLRCSECKEVIPFRFPVPKTCGKVKCRVSRHRRLQASQAKDNHDEHESEDTCRRP